MPFTCENCGGRSDLIPGDVAQRIRWWADFNTDPVTAANELPQATVIDASRTTDLVEKDVRDWISVRVVRG